MQHIAGALVTYDIHAPRIYAIEHPTFKKSIAIKVPYDVYWCARLEKNVQSNREVSIVVLLKFLKKTFRNMQVTRKTKILDYYDLCIHLDIDILVGYKPSKFDVFDEKETLMHI